MIFARKVFCITLLIFLTGATYNVGRSPIEVEDLADGVDGELISWGADGVAAAVAVGTSGQVLKSNGIGAAPTFQNESGGSASVVIISDEKAAGTAGGTFTAGSWQTRVLNTIKVNDGTIASLSSNQVTLPAGTYECIASAPAQAVEEHMIRLQDITAGSTIAYGTSENAALAVNASTRSFLYTKFTLSEESDLEIQHRGIASKATNGFGEDTNFGTTETFAVVMFRKVD